MNKLAKLFANKKRGFTLIELIVVIAILGILAAILVPSMIGFMDDATKGKLQANCRAAYTAAQSYMASQTASGGSAPTSISKDNITKYMGAITGEVDVTIVSGAITAVKYTEGGKSITYTVSSGTFGDVTTAS